MNYTYITNMRHLIPEDPATDLPTSVLKMRKFLGHIVKATTATNEISFASPLPCRKLINRKSCTGMILINRQDLPKQLILWHCDSCEDGGTISNFADTWYDLRKFKNEVQPEENEKIVQVELTRLEYKALIQPDVTIYDPDSEKIIYSARATKSGAQLRAYEGEMDFFLGFVAADSNHEKNRNRANLVGSVYNKISDQLDELFDA